MNYLKKEQLLLVKSKLCGFAHVSSRLTKDIKRAKKEKKIDLLRFKQSLSRQSRHHLIAYALIRGRSYLSVENNCNEHNKPDPNLILTIIHENIVNSWISRKEWTIERVKKLLER